MSDLKTDDLMNSLIGTITRIVTAAGGRVDSVRYLDRRIVAVDISGLPDGPLTPAQQRAVEELEKIGIKCRGRNADG